MKSRKQYRTWKQDCKRPISILFVLLMMTGCAVQTADFAAPPVGPQPASGGGGGATGPGNPELTIRFSVTKECRKLSPAGPITYIVDYIQSDGKWRTDERLNATANILGSQSFDGYNQWVKETALNNEVDVWAIDENERPVTPGYPYTLAFQPGHRAYTKAAYALEGTMTILGRVTEIYSKTSPATLTAECAQRMGTTTSVQKKISYYLDTLTGVPLRYRLQVVGSTVVLEEYLASSVQFSAPSSTAAYQLS